MNFPFLLSQPWCSPWMWWVEAILEGFGLAKGRNLYLLIIFCLAGLKMIVAKHRLQSPILMWFILVSRVVVQLKLWFFQSDWPSFSQQFASAVIRTCLCNPRDFREVWGRVCEPNQSEALLLLAGSKYDPCGWFDSLVCPQIPFCGDYKAQTNILICDKQLHKVIYGEKIQSNSAPALFWFFKILFLLSVITGMKSR